MIAIRSYAVCMDFSATETAVQKHASMKSEWRMLSFHQLHYSFPYKILREAGFMLRYAYTFIS